MVRSALLGIGLLVTGITIAGCAEPPAPEVASDGSGDAPLTESVDCAPWLAINEWVSAQGGVRNNPSTSEELWYERLALTEALVAAAPSAYEDHAATYLQLVKDRLELVAPYDYAPVMALPLEVRAAFVQSHRAEQATSNEFLSHMATACGSDINRMPD